MFLLDTMVVSELRKRRSGRAHPHVRRWADAQDETQFFLSVITNMEVRTGVLLAARKDPRKAAHLEHWRTQQLEPQFRNRVLPVTDEIALRCAELHFTRTRSVTDSLIAATALVHNLTVVTRNIDDFVETGVRILNPWLSPARISHA